MGLGLGLVTLRPLVPLEMKLVCRAVKAMVKRSAFGVFERGKGFQKGHWRLLMARWSGAAMLLLLQCATVLGAERERLVAEVVKALEAESESFWTASP